MKYSYSIDGDRFSGEYESINDAAVDAFKNNSDINDVYIGEIVYMPTSHYVMAETILYEIADRAYEECGGIVGEWIERLIKKNAKMKELEILIGDWIDKNDPKNFWLVDNVITVSRSEILLKNSQMLESISIT
jgi:hypothetical protein